MFDQFIINALIAGIGVAIVASILGCFVVWRRMAYFGDSLAHSSLLGIALGLLTGINVSLSTILVCSFFAAMLVWLQHKKVLATDTLLGILAHGALSIGMVTISLLGQRVDLHAYLFGDILTVGKNEIYLIYGLGILVCLILWRSWSSLVLMTINEDIAKADGVKTFVLQLLFMFLMTVVVAISIRVVGILLITSMLIIPAATARQIARSPHEMALFAALIGIASVLVGLFGSINFDSPTGPTIVTASALMFAIIFPVALARKR